MTRRIHSFFLFLVDAGSLKSHFATTLNCTLALAAAALTASMCIAFPPVAAAQTAHFSGSYLTVPSSGLTSPFGVAVDSSGKVYVADTINNRVVIETPSAGGYTQATVATSTTLNGPRAVAVDSSGNLYIADAGNNRVLMETPTTSGGVTTWAETTVANYAVNGLDVPTAVAVDSNHVVYIASAGNDRALKMTPVAGTPYSEAVLNPGLTMLYGIAVDSNFNIYYADYSTGDVYVSVWSGTTYGTALLLQSGLSYPTAVSVDGAGNVYIADSGHGQIFKDTFEGSSYIGAPLVYPLDNPLGVAVDASGNVYIANTGTSQILESTGGNFGSVAIGTKSAGMILNFVIDSSVGLFFNPPTGDFSSNIDCLESENPYLAPPYLYSEGDVCSVEMTFTPTMAGLRTSAFDLTGYKQYPGGDVLTLATAPVSGFGSGPQVSFAAGTQTAISIGSSHRPGPLAVDPSGDFVLIDLNPWYQNLELLSLSASSTLINITTPDEGKPDFIWAEMQHPQTLAVDAGYNIYEYDSNSDIYGVLKWTQNSASGGNYTSNGIGLFTSTVDSPFPAVAVDASGNLYITDSANAQVLKETPSGGGYIQTTAAGASAGLFLPVAVAVDGYGNFYIANADQDGGWEIYKETLSNGVYSQSTIGQNIPSATAIAVDASENVYLLDKNDNVVIKETFASGGYVQSQMQIGNLGQAAGIALDGSGNLYISDSSKSQILKVDYVDPPTLSFASTGIGATSAAQIVAVQNSGTSPLTFSAISYPANFPESSGATSDCAVSTPLPAGASCTLSVTFRPNGLAGQNGWVVLTDNALNGSATQQSIVVGGTAIQGSQTINFPAITDQLATTTLGLSASASSGLTVGFQSLTLDVCTTSGATASLLTKGTCTIEAAQGGSTDYTAAPAVQQSFAVHHQTQTISFPAITGSQYALTSLPLSASASSSLAVNFDSTTPAVCTVEGSTASLLTAGNCVIQANQPGDGAYSVAPQVSQYFKVLPVSQTINFPAITATQVAATTLGLSASATSGLTVSFASTTPTVCTVLNATASLLTSGTCTIQAMQAGGGAYSAAPPVQQSFAVHHQTQSISFPAITGPQYVLSQLVLSATASSGLKVAFTSATSTVCSVSGATASLLTTGTCVIHANLAGNTTYSVAPQVSQYFAVLRAPQTINFPAITGNQVAAATLGLTATAGSGLTVTFTSTTLNVCTVTGATATLLIPGVCAIQATQPGSDDYTAAAMIQQNFVVRHHAQTISFPGMGSQPAGTSVLLAATASSGLPVSYTATTPAFCTISADGMYAVLSNAGICTVQANQAGNAAYSLAPQVTVHFTVAAAE